MVLMSSAQAAQAGRARRKAVPRAALGLWEGDFPGGDRDPLAIIDEQNETRLQELVPLRMERMAQSAFTFYRGTAAIMAADLAKGQHSGIMVAACGDAHVSNFGFYASPQRTLLFDLNDFDEAAWAPWEWDLKRLTTSIIVAGQATHRDTAVILEAARNSITSYLRATRSIAQIDPLARYYTHFDPESAMGTLDKDSKKAVKRATKAAMRRTGERAAGKLTEIGHDGRSQFLENPPAIARATSDTEEVVRQGLERYIASANVDVQMLLQQYEMVDVARRAVGVGSVGTRCLVSLMSDADSNHLVLQTKQAGRSVLEQYGGIEQPALVNERVSQQGQGARVVSLQRILQAYSDPFLGFFTNDLGDFYVRQFHDMKGGIDTETLSDAAFLQYARSCAIVLARAHCQSGRSAEITAYAGKGPQITAALLDWCFAYARTATADFVAFEKRLAQSR